MQGYYVMFQRILEILNKSTEGPFEAVWYSNCQTGVMGWTIQDKWQSEVIWISQNKNPNDIVVKRAVEEANKAYAKTKLVLPKFPSEDLSIISFANWMLRLKQKNPNVEFVEDGDDQN